MDFKNFLLNEDNGYLGNKVSDVLTSLHDLQDDMPHMGTRQVTRLADDVVNHLRKILHSQWSPAQQKHLLQIQKVAVALKKAIEDKGDLKELIPSAAEELENLSTKLGVKQKDSKVLDKAAELEGEDASQDDMELTSQQDRPLGKPQQPLQQNPQQPPQGPQSFPPPEGS